MLRLVTLTAPPTETYRIVDEYYNDIITGDGYALAWELSSGNGEPQTPETGSSVGSLTQKIYPVVDHAANAVFNAVQYVNQTYVDALKEADKFDASAQRVAYNRALDAAKKALSQETVTFIKNTFGDLDSYLKLMIESQVRSQKVYM